MDQNPQREEAPTVVEDRVARVVRSPSVSKRPGAALSTLFSAPIDSPCLRSTAHGRGCQTGTALAGPGRDRRHGAAAFPIRDRAPGRDSSCPCQAPMTPAWHYAANRNAMVRVFGKKRRSMGPEVRFGASAGRGSATPHARRSPGQRLQPEGVAGVGGDRGRRPGYFGGVGDGPARSGDTCASGCRRRSERKRGDNASCVARRATPVVAHAVRIPGCDAPRG